MPQSTTLLSIITEHSCNTSPALGKHRDMIMTYIPQGSLSYCSEKAKVDISKSL